jgi:hypothetical protein
VKFDHRILTEIGEGWHVGIGLPLPFRAECDGRFMSMGTIRKQREGHERVVWRARSAHPLAQAVIFVVAEELMPASRQGGHTDLATLATLGGFANMMTLDVALG